MEQGYDPSSFFGSGDFDLADPAFVADPFPAWAAARDCPVHTTSLRGGAHVVTGYDAVVEAANALPKLTSEMGVAVFPVAVDQVERRQYSRSIIDTDPPDHTPIRRLILPTFAPRMVERFEALTRELCERYVAEHRRAPRVDGARDYAQRIPARVIGSILGVPEDDTDMFIGWVRDVLENSVHEPARAARSAQELMAYFARLVEERRQSPADDLTTILATASTESGPLEQRDVIGNLSLMLIAGIDTTWSAIGSGLWHLANHPEHRRALLGDPDLWPQAIEELLRAYSPVTMARTVVEDTTIGGCPVQNGDRVILSFAAANRDPAVFPDADTVDFNRAVNRHIAFGVGVHRCAGSNIARMELRVALQTWLEAFPDFEIDPESEILWAGGQVRGPRQLPLLIRTRSSSD